jgi:two-component system OmpR family response regulator
VIESNLNAVMTSLVKILIVDDEVDICYFLSRNLTRRNFGVSYVHSLEDAETQLEQEKPTIVLLDNHLPDGYGINYITKIKSKYPDTKIIMTTAHDSPQDRSKAYTNGVDFFLSKPFTITEVNKVIDVLLEREDE